MKTRNVLVPIFCALVLAAPAVAIASAPSQTTDVSPLTSAQRKNKTEKVTPCDSHDNGDTVVTNDCGHLGDAFVTPSQGTPGSSTTIKTDNHFEGSVTGFDANDVLNCGPNNKLSVTATGGTVNLGGGSTLSLSVTAGTGSGNVTVKLPNGTALSVAPGSNIVVTTVG